jgi:predicted Fe-S protein YdhL (DUF1289 family)
MKDFNPTDMTDDVPSPCISVCVMNAHTGLCEGCTRTIDEIVQWSTASNHAKREIWAEIRRRREVADDENFS